MPGRKLNLPPFAALRAFQAAATHPRYRDAADTLGLTESAISHQVRRLEEFVRASLIERSGGRPRLTETGRRYLERIEPALREIHEATEALLPGSGRQVARLTLPPSLAATWLIPRLGAFEREQPDIDLQLVTTTRVVDLRRDQVDLAIRHGRGAWPGIEAAFLLQEAAMPVCAPGYLGAGDTEVGPDLLSRARLIVTASFPAEWEEWARARGLEPPSLAGSITMDAMEQALQVAESGHGMAMGRRPMVDERLRQGRLIAPLGDADPTGAAYYLCKPEAARPTAAARRLERWLLAVAARWRDEALDSD